MRNIAGHALQVEEAACRVAKLRAKVPADLSKHFKARLQACRPIVLNAAPVVAAAQPSGDEALPSALSPAPAQLRGKLSGAAMQLPILRCACLPHMTTGILTGLLQKRCPCVACPASEQGAVHCHLSVICGGIKFCQLIDQGRPETRAERKVIA